MCRALLTTLAGLAASLAAAAAAAAQQPAVPIPGPLDGPLPRYQGAPVDPQPLEGLLPPANPALAPDGRSGSGLSAGNGAASQLPGPLGRSTAGTSALQFGTCASLAFDVDERLLAVCNGAAGPTLRLIDPQTLATIATLALPPRRSPDRTDLAGGTHFVVRADGSLLVPTNDGTLITVAVEPRALRQTATIGLGWLLRQGERPFAVAAGYDGNDWVAGNQGTVVTVPRDGGPPRAVSLGEPVAEDLATHPTGAYVVTTAALYRLRAGGDGAPEVVWRQPIAALPPAADSGRIHPGSGTPPVVVADEFVAVADAADPPRVTVVRIEGESWERLACAIPVFRAGAGGVEAHLVAAGRSVVAMNSHGYANLMTTEGGGTATGGVARVDIGEYGCNVAWTSAAISPSAQSVVSRATGLLYTLVKPPGFPDAWNLAALDWRTGETRFQALAGEGLGYNSEGGAVVLGPDGSAYAGTFGGVVRFSDR